MLLFAITPGRTDLRRSEILKKNERPPCEDKDNDCRYWAHQGECESSWTWMSHHCAKSCGACLGTCDDSIGDCVGWAAAGECEANERFMLERCPLSCDLCPRFTGRKRECDSCLAMQEVAWRLLQPQQLPATGSARFPQRAHQRAFNRIALETSPPPAPPPSPSPIVTVHWSRLPEVLAELCSSPQWWNTGASIHYHRLCERQMSQHFEQMIGSWQTAFFPHLQHDGMPVGGLDPANVTYDAPLELVLNRRIVLDQKWALCTSPAPLGMGECTESHVDALQLGRSLTDEPCQICRAFVTDAVALFRRTGRTFKPSDWEGYELAKEQLHDICDDLEMRHNISSSSMPLVQETCSKIAAEHLGALQSIVTQWPRKGLVDYMCTATLSFCKTVDQQQHDELRLRL